MAGFFNPHSFEKRSKGTPKRITQCGKCGLASKCLSPKMTYGGSGEVGILFIRNAVSEQDDQFGQFFTDAGSEFLRECAKELGYDLEDCWMSYAICCHPGEDLEPYMVSCCRPAIYKTIKELKPKVIVTLGRYALESVIKDIWGQDIGKFERWIGWKIPFKEYNCWLCPVNDPDYVLGLKKMPVAKLMFRNNIKEVFKVYDKKPNYAILEDLESQIEIVSSTKRAKKLLEDLSTKSGYLAWDYETTGLKPDRQKQKIVSVSFCYNGKKTFAFMMRPGLQEALKAVLTNPRLKKIASNLKFEERWTLAKYGYSVAGWYWDTMLMAHCIDNRSYITSVKFQAFVLLGIGDYDSHIKPYLRSKFSNTLNQIFELDKKELLLYNGMDSLLEYKVMEIQRQIYNGEA